MSDADSLRNLRERVQFYRELWMRVNEPDGGEQPSAEDIRDLAMARGVLFAAADPPPPVVEVFSRPECIFNYCPSPAACHAACVTAGAPASEPASSARGPRSAESEGRA